MRKLFLGISMSAEINPINQNVVNPTPSDNDTPFPDIIGKDAYFTVLFYLLLSSMTIRQSTVMTQSKQICANASIQDRLNKMNADIKFSILPENAKTEDINRVQEENQQYAALRQNIQNMLITARQNAQVMMTQTSTNVNILQQDASENAGWLQTLNTIFEVIDEMTQKN
jgi:hypothetical protein